MQQRGAQERRAALGTARLMLIFTPDMCTDGDPAHKLAQLLPLVDVVQLRIKPKANATVPHGAPSVQAPARETYDWALRGIALCEGLERPPLLIVNDRVDVALALADRGIDGVHVGRGDLPCSVARELLGPELLIGLSTHNAGQAALAEEEGADYVGLGPIFATETKGYARGIGPETAWVASVGSGLPLFPIGGIDGTNVNTLMEVGRAALGSALLNACDAQRAAGAMRDALDGTKR